MEFIKSELFVLMNLSYKGLFYVIVSYIYINYNHDIAINFSNKLYTNFEKDKVQNKCIYCCPLVS